jgi:nudix-type nucleoside diphosphatase (YffH/AdpP family)
MVPAVTSKGNNMQTHAPHVRHVRETLLSDNWYTLKKYTFELLRRDGRWQEQSREAYDRGNGAVILLYNREKRTVVLTRQFRFPVFTHGHDGYLIEAAAGLLDNASPEARIVAEAEEETGFRVTRIEPVFTVFMSPGSVTEKLYFFIAEYQADDRQGDGGGWRRKVRTLKCWSGRWRGRCRPFAMARSWMLKPLSCCSTWR